MVLMGTKYNICTPRNGEPLIAATQDFITGAYLLTQRNVFLTRGEISQLVTVMCDGHARIDLPPPAILKPAALWTGAQVFSLLLRPNRKSDVIINLETPNRSYDKVEERKKKEGEG